MHKSALKYGRLFFETYCGHLLGLKKIVDVGSKDINGSLRQYAPKEVSYIGVDFEVGNGVDIVLGDPYELPFEDSSIDIVVCNSVFEHSEFFWLLFLECLRILKPEGLLYLNAPSNGFIHRYPVDSWRFYPDSGRSLVNWANKNLLSPFLLESFIGEKDGPIDGEGVWNDFVAVFLKDQQFQSMYPLRIVDQQHGCFASFNSLKKNQIEPFLLNPDSTLISSQREQITALHQLTANKDEQITALHQLTANKDEQITALHQLTANKDEQIKMIYESTSWLITKPIRLIREKYLDAKEGKKKWILQLGRWCLNLSILSQSFFFRASSVSRLACEVVPLELNFSEINSEEYKEWIRLYDTLDAEKIIKINGIIRELAWKPKVSILLNSHNSDPIWIMKAIESVRSQIYSNWELCILEDFSSSLALQEIVHSFSNKDSRIKIIHSEEKDFNNSYTIAPFLDMACGEWIIILNPADELSLDALASIIQVINKNSELRLIYSDEDCIDESGIRSKPKFKSDWNLDLFYSQNFVSNLAAFHRKTIVEIGGGGINCKIMPTFNLCLHLIEHIGPEKIYHIPNILYHRRQLKIESERCIELNHFALPGGDILIQEHFDRVNIKATAEYIGHGYQIKYQLPDLKPLVSLIIPTKNSVELIRACVRSILQKTTYPNYEILIIDNNSSKQDALDYFQRISENQRVKVIRDEMIFNYSALNNRAIKKAGGKLIGLLNDDVEVINPEWLSEMVSHALRPDVGAVGAKLLYPNNTVQHAGIVTGILDYAGHLHKNLNNNCLGYLGRLGLTSNFSAVTAACLIIRREVYDEVGGLNEVDLKIACNDVDLCLRIRTAGYRIVLTPFALLYHHESSTRGYEDTSEKQRRFKNEIKFMKNTWGDLLLNDPMYNPNLTLSKDSLGLAYPPRWSLWTK